MRGYAWKFGVKTADWIGKKSFNGAMRGYAWKYNGNTNTLNDTGALQWSHAWLRMEIGFRQQTERRWLTSASMEPCVVTHGNLWHGWRQDRPQAASMEPCVVTHGNACIGIEPMTFSMASMEPCVVTHGN
tara:strand:- start:73 stop:462 length:390 start_codon:yes stop_codon:yes gene_type:complete